MAKINQLAYRVEWDVKPCSTNQLIMSTLHFSNINSKLEIYCKMLFLSVIYFVC